VDVGQHGQRRRPGAVAVEHDPQALLGWPHDRFGTEEEAPLVDEPGAAPPVDYLAGPPVAEGAVAAEEPADDVGSDGELLADPAQDGDVPFGDEHTALSAGGAKERDQEIALLVDLVFGEERHQQLFEDRLGEFVTALSPARLTRSQRQVGALAAARERAVFSHHLGEMEEWRTWLRTVADHLENIERRVREAPAEADT
jgi:hypothetical protein